MARVPNTRRIRTVFMISPFRECGHCTSRASLRSCSMDDIVVADPSHFSVVSRIDGVTPILPSQTLQATVGQTAEELQAAVEATARWTMVRAELTATLDGVTSAVLT